MEICKAPTLWLKALNNHTHIMYIEIENVIQKKRRQKRVYIDKCSSIIMQKMHTLFILLCLCLCLVLLCLCLCLILLCLCLSFSFIPPTAPLPAPYTHTYLVSKTSVHPHEGTHTCAHARTHTCMHACTRARAHARTHARTHTHSANLNVTDSILHEKADDCLAHKLKHV